MFTKVKVAPQSKQKTGSPHWDSQESNVKPRSGRRWWHHSSAATLPLLEEYRTWAWGSAGGWHKWGSYSSRNTPSDSLERFAKSWYPCHPSLTPTGISYSTHRAVCHPHFLTNTQTYLVTSFLKQIPFTSGKCLSLHSLVKPFQFNLNVFEFAYLIKTIRTLKLIPLSNI